MSFIEYHELALSLASFARLISVSAIDDGRELYLGASEWEEKAGRLVQPQGRARLLYSAASLAFMACEYRRAYRLCLEAMGNSPTPDLREKIERTIMALNKKV